MGIKVDFGGSNDNSKGFGLLEEGNYIATFKEFQLTTNKSNGKMGFGPVFHQVQDAVMVDAEGEETSFPAKGRVWPSRDFDHGVYFYFTALWAFKRWATELGVDLADLDGQEFDDEKEFVEAAAEFFEGEWNIEVTHNKYNGKTTAVVASVS